MFGNPMIGYTVEIPCYRRTIWLYGTDTEENQNKAIEEFIRQIKDDVKGDAEIVFVETDVDYENEYRASKEAV
ncbi:MAG: hypothetical protein LBC76_08080 [Treponema sp.]|jgi:hypothetical protein|nr:hypothetical protein [Treponema sp.]